MVDGGRDPSFPERHPECLAVIPFVGTQTCGPSSLVPDLESVHCLESGGEVVRIGFCGQGDKREPITIHENTAFQAVFLLVAGVANLIVTPLLFCLTEASR